VRREHALSFAYLTAPRCPDCGTCAFAGAEREWGAHAGVAHRLIWAAFADDPERKRDFLWRQDEKRRWLALSSRLPRDPHQLFEVESKPFAPVLEKGHRLAFALRANAVVTRKDEDGCPKRCDIVMDRLLASPKGERAAERGRLAVEAGRDWLSAQAAKAGFCLDRVDVIAYRTEKIPRQREKPIELGVLDLEGDITVETPEPFLAALAAGFGKGKSFGCGLMLIRRRR
jgi:CRISPR system Cascade subunit CasE